MGLIDSSLNGATEIPGTTNKSLVVFLAGPIRYWWTPGMRDSRAFRVYSNQRNIVHAALSEEFLVYAPNLAWRGPWDDRAQSINDAAVEVCDAFVYLDPGVPMDGTREELSLALSLGKRVFQIKCGDDYAITHAVAMVTNQLMMLRDR